MKKVKSFICRRRKNKMKKSHSYFTLEENEEKLEENYPKFSEESSDEEEEKVEEYNILEDLKEFDVNKMDVIKRQILAIHESADFLKKHGQLNLKSELDKINKRYDELNKILSNAYDKLDKETYQFIKVAINEDKKKLRIRRHDINNEIDKLEDNMDQNKKHLDKMSDYYEMCLVKKKLEKL